MPLLEKNFVNSQKCFFFERQSVLRTDTHKISQRKTVARFMLLFVISSGKLQLNGKYRSLPIKFGWQLC